MRRCRICAQVWPESQVLAQLEAGIDCYSWINTTVSEKSVLPSMRCDLVRTVGEMIVCVNMLFKSGKQPRSFAQCTRTASQGTRSLVVLQIQLSNIKSSQLPAAKLCM